VLASGLTRTVGLILLTIGLVVLVYTLAMRFI
jgi:hypothetical protein